MFKITKSDIVDYLYITFATLLYSVAVAFFLLPYQLTTGGVAGIGALVFYATGFEVQNTYLLVNLVLLVFAIKELGWRFCVKTVYAVLVLSFMLWLAQRVYELCGSPMIVGEELFLACLIGAIFEGVGLGMCFMAGGSTGGTDIIAAIVNKYRNMSLGTVIMMLDVIIISSCYFVFYDVQRVVFGFVLLIVSSLTLDFYITRNRQAVEFKIYSRNPYPIADQIIKTNHGVTIMDGIGYYTRSERKVIVSVVRKREQAMFLRMIKSIDPFAFVTMGNVSGVWGEGFDPMKVRMKSNALMRKIVVLTTDDAEEISKVSAALGERYEVRSLTDVGCNVNYPVNSDIQCDNAALKARFVKNFYGFDAIAYGKSLNESNEYIYAVSTGDPLTAQCFIEKFHTLEEVKTYLDAQK